MIVASTVKDSGRSISQTLDVLKSLIIHPGNMKTLQGLCQYDYTALDHVLDSNIEVGTWEFTAEDQPTVLKVLGKLGGTTERFVTKGGLLLITFVYCLSNITLV